MYGIWRGATTSLSFIFKPAIALAAVAAPANAGVEEVIESVGHSGVSLWNLLFGLILTLAAYIWKRQLKDLEDYKKQSWRELSDYKKLVADERKEHREGLTKRLDGMDKEIESALRADYFREHQLTIHSGIENLRTDMNRVVQEQFSQINAQRDRLQHYELSLASKYHTKEEISDLLTDKISPVLDEMRQVKMLLMRQGRKPIN